MSDLQYKLLDNQIVYWAALVGSLVADHWLSRLWLLLVAALMLWRRQQIRKGDA